MIERHHTHEEQRDFRFLWNCATCQAFREMWKKEEDRMDKERLRWEDIKKDDATL